MANTSIDDPARPDMSGDERTERRGVEERAFPVNEVELRGENSTAPVLHGYASTFNQPYDVHDRFGTFSETILPAAWTRSLQQRGDKIHLLVAHGGIPLAASHSDTLRLSQDTHGLEYEAQLDAANPLAQQVISAVQRGDMDEMSVGMRIPTGGDRWSDDNLERFISEAALIEISVLSRGANPGTEAAMREAELLAEIRRLEEVQELFNGSADEQPDPGLLAVLQRRALHNKRRYLQ